VEPRGPLPGAQALAVRALAFADARGAGAQHDRDAVGAMAGNGGIHRGPDRRQRQRGQGIVAPVQGHRQRAQVRQVARHQAQRQRAARRHGLGRRHAARRVAGEQPCGHGVGVAAQRAAQAQFIEEDRAHGATGTESMRRR